MLAAQFDGQTLKLLELPRPIPGNEDVLIKVMACGICGTDLKILTGKSAASPPVFLGHEFCGIVEDLGADVNDFATGDFVSIDPNIYCGECHFCRQGRVHLCENLVALGVNINGGFAEYCRVPVAQCYKIPKTTNPLQTALIEPLSCALYGYQKAGIQSGETVIIVGGGMIGLLMLKLCHLSAARRIIVVEPNESRQTILMNAGADNVVNPTDKSFLDGDQRRADVVIECVGSVAAVDQSYRYLKRGGRMIIFGVSPSDQDWKVSPYDIFRNDITITGSFLNPYTFQTAVDLLTSGKIKLHDVDMQPFPLRDIADAFDFQRIGKSMKTIIEFDK